MERQKKSFELKKSLLILSALLFVLLTSCATSPPDIPVCTELTLDRAYCVHTISGNEFVFDETHPVDGKTFWEARPTMLLMPYTSWVKLKTWIIQECKITGTCNSEISSWDRTLDRIESIVIEK